MRWNRWNEGADRPSRDNPVGGAVWGNRAARAKRVGRADRAGAAPLAVLATVCLVLAGCNAAPAGPQDGSPAQSGSAPGGGSWAADIDASGSQAAQASKEAAAREAAARELENARHMAAQYDYDGALKLLGDSTAAGAAELREEIAGQKSHAVRWKDNSKISHLFFHSLIVDPQRAFDGGPSSAGYADYMVTVREFKAMLSSIYDKGYVLVNPHDIAAKNEDGVMEYTRIRLPKGKKPLVISEDDVSYYEYMQGDGFATNLTLDKDGNVTNTYTDARGKTTHGAYDMPTIVDDFVAKHPDFSYRGSKGILALTGYNGVLGYRTSDAEYGNDKRIAEKKAQAKRVADALKADGWVFASHAWGHINMTDSTLGRIKRDTAAWDREVRPILGDTDLLIFPFGADLAGVEQYSGAKYRLLKEDGFDYFFGVDSSTPYWMQKTDDYLRQARINVDGLRMASDLAGKGNALKPFFDVKKVIDPARPGH
jgi:hypothetical protein